jgi:thiol:disulfide interchange protein DsbA
MKYLILLLLSSFSVFSEPKLNVDYIEIPEGLVKEKGVTEIFWYGCPACLEYENTLKKIKEIDPTIEVNKIPQFRLPAAKTYYTIESLNLGDEVHDKVFKDWQLKRKPLGSDKDVENFAKRHNLDVENFMRVYNSFSINIKAKNAIAVPRKLIENGIDFKGTPTVVVNGKYIVTRQRNVSKEIENIIFLLNE